MRALFVAAVVALVAAALLVDAQSRNAAVCPYLKAASCKKSPVCRWDDGLQACFPGCKRHTTEESCRLSFRCRWFFNNNSCEDSYAGCNAIEDSDMCGAFADSCHWGVRDGIPACWSNCNKLYSSARACDADLRCRWNNGTCGQSCALAYANVFECDALSQGKCAWVPQAQACRNSCVKQYSTAAACSADALCRWDYVKGMCGARCDRRVGAADCVANDFCEWNKRGFCQASCIRFPTEFTCAAEAGCRWSFTTGKCEGNVQGCDALLNKVACAQQRKNGCGWIVIDGRAQCRHFE